MPDYLIDGQHPPGRHASRLPFGRGHGLVALVFCVLGAGIFDVALHFRFHYFGVLGPGSPVAGFMLRVFEAGVGLAIAALLASLVFSRLGLRRTVTPAQPTSDKVMAIAAVILNVILAVVIATVVTLIARG